MVALGQEPEHTTLQGLIWPDSYLETDPTLYLRAPSQPRDAFGPLILTSGQTATFDTYFNLFNLGKWRTHCALTDLSLTLSGTGKVTLSISYSPKASSTSTTPAASAILLCETYTLTPENVVVPIHLPIEQDTALDRTGILWFAIHAQDGAATLHDAAWQTHQSPVRTPDLTLAITTFRREEAVQTSVARFEDFIATSELVDHLHMVVVDNGQSADIAQSPHVTSVLNANLGGSGGFARGLIEARKRGASHCLFMDDDASVHMQSIERTWRFLSYATDHKTAVAGALGMAATSWAMWENGALFDRHCLPRHSGTDLRNPDEVMQMEFESSAPAPHNLYGGWWYFAFPVDHPQHMPFPFFVRGDDISFSLVHDFNITTLPGVLSFQDQDFADKESLQTLYLDQRNHLIQHLSIPAMEIGPLRCLSIAWWFFARSALQLHYDSLEALNLSFKDTLSGPDFFAANADMSARRGDLNAMRGDEAWKDITGPAPTARTWFNPNRFLIRLLMKLSVNGHLIPFFRSFGNHVILEPGQRGTIRKTWGAAQITYWDEVEGKWFTVTHSKRQFLRAFAGLLHNSWRFLRTYKTLRKTWRQGYAELTTQDWWEETLKLEKSDTK